MFSSPPLKNPLCTPRLNNLTPEPAHMLPEHVLDAQRMVSPHGLPHYLISELTLVDKADAYQAMRVILEHFPF
jgi:hypothetical protein